MVTARLFAVTVCVMALGVELTGYAPGTPTGAAQGTFSPGDGGSLPPPQPPAPPVITSFSAVRANGRVWSLEGTVESDDDQVTIQFSNMPSLQGLTTTVNPDGSFWTTVTLAPGEDGLAGAQAVDSLNQKSDIEYAPIAQD